MTGVLILAHGSREKTTEESFQIIVNKVKEKQEYPYIEKAFLYFSISLIQVSSRDY